MDRADFSWSRNQELAAPGKTELVQHGTGGNKAGHTGQIDQAKHTGHLRE